MYNEKEKDMNVDMEIGRQRQETGRGCGHEKCFIQLQNKIYAYCGSEGA
jgi:hypothetical protein